MKMSRRFFKQRRRGTDKIRPGFGFVNLINKCQNFYVLEPAEDFANPRVESITIMGFVFKFESLVVNKGQILHLDHTGAQAFLVNTRNKGFDYFVGSRVDIQVVQLIAEPDLGECT
jgi:hypothetical protein